MKEYLLSHNVTIFDFWFLVCAWIFGVILLIFLWMATVKAYKIETKYNEYHNLLFPATTIMISCIGVPVLAMGLWHFLNMILTLNFGFNLYWY